MKWTFGGQYITQWASQNFDVESRQIDVDISMWISQRFFDAK